MKKLSIITVNLNNANGLQKTIESIVSQTFNDYEYIIIDGGSTDDSISVIKKYANNIHYWESNSDRGVYHAMNKGIFRANGEYCLFLNSGDYLLNKDVLQNIFSQNITKDLIYGNILISKKKLVKKTYPEYLRFSFFWNQSLPHPATFIKKELFDKVGLYNENRKIVSDWEFFLLALFQYHCTYQYIPITVSVFDMTGISSTMKTASRNEKTTVYNTYFPAFLEDCKELIYARRRLSKIDIHKKISRGFKKLKTKISGSGNDM